MSSKKSSARAEEVPVIKELKTEQRLVVCSLNLVYGKIENDYPSILERTSESWTDLTSALYHHIQALSHEIINDKIRNSPTIPAFPLQSNKYSQRIPRFVNFLKRHGRIGISEHVDESKERKRLGIFLKNNLIGFLDVLDSSDSLENHSEIHYQGYVPGIRYKKHVSIYHIEDIPGFSYVQLVCSNPGTPQELREDNWKIPFP